MPDYQPPDTPLTRTFRARSWVVPTVGLVAIVAAVVVLGNLGKEPAASNHPTSVAAAATQRPIVPARSLTVVQRPFGSAAAGLIGSPIGLRLEGDSYVDGIPAVIDGNQVVRVRDAAALPIGAAVLVGGWAQRSACPGGATAPVSCGRASLSDIPSRSPRVATLLLAGQADFDYGQGPRVYIASIENDPSCAFSAKEACLPRLDVGDPVWQGDDKTAAAPFAPETLISDLGAQFPALDIRPFEEATPCPVHWPVQSYAVSSAIVPRAQWIGLPVRLVVIYPSTNDLVLDGPSTRAAAAQMSAFDASNRCVSIPGGVNNNAWIVRDNVMLLLGAQDDSVRGQVNSLLDQLTPAGLSPVRSPVVGSQPPA